MNIEQVETFELEPGAGPGTVELSIVLPALNEEINIGECVDWCFEGFRKAGTTGEVLIVDSSTDRTPQIALAHGARVIKTPKLGLGRAYIEAMPFIRGRFVLMGDCDCTYDFRDLGGFLERLREGNEFIMGSRFKGSIEPGAMPPHHQYFGTPLTTWILNLIFSSRFSDIHCGMRGITLDGLRRMGIRSQGWEYASEMVIKSVQMKLRTAEVPVHFYKDRNGRVSHLRRSGWWTPWVAGWVNLKAMFIYGADFFLTKPGTVLLVLGAMLVMPLIFGPQKVGRITFSIFWMLLGAILSLIGIQCLYLGALSQVFFDFSGEATLRLSRRYPYTRSTVVSLVGTLAGLTLLARFALEYRREGLILDPVRFVPFGHLAVLGFLLILWSFTNFVFTLIFHGYLASNQRRVHSGDHHA